MTADPVKVAVLNGAHDRALIIAGDGRSADKAVVLPQASRA